MDKIAANNHIVLLRKEIKKAKCMVSGNLIRKIDKLKREKEKSTDEKLVAKLDTKIESTLKDIKLLKQLDPYPIAKQALLNGDLNHWKRIVSDSKQTPEQILQAKVICKNNVIKNAIKFRTDYKDCDAWLEEYFEFREKKKDIVNPNKNAKKKGTLKSKQINPRKDMEEESEELV